MICSLVGVIFVSKKSESSVKKNLPYLISFSAGVFLFTSGFMALEAYHLFENGLLVGSIVLLGYTLATLLSKISPELDHHHHTEENCGSQIKKGGRSILFADAFHNIADGLIIIAAFSVSPVLGFGIAVSIFIHEALQEISEFFVLKKAGYSTKKALLYNFIVSSTILIGVGIGVLISNTQNLQGVLLALSAGLFFYIITHDLFPHTKNIESESTSAQTAKRLGALIFGLLLVGGIHSVSGGHSHDHGSHEDHGHQEVGHTDHDDHHGHGHHGHSH